MIDEEEVDHITLLARIKVQDKDKGKYVDKINQILEYFQILDEIPEEVEPLFQVFENMNVFREDSPEPSLEQKEVLKNPKKVKDGYITGPRML